MRRTVYLETSIVNYLVARPSRDVRAAAWQQLTTQWWESVRPRYELFVSELVLVEASRGDAGTAARRLSLLAGVPVLKVDEESRALAERLIAEGAMPTSAEPDALHVAIATVHGVNYLLTWNCRHIDNAALRPLLRSVCAAAGYRCPEICTPLELLAEEDDDVPR
jgi:predicted nucleic acid-binding protein